MTLNRILYHRLWNINLPKIRVFLTPSVRLQNRRDVSGTGLPTSCCFTDIATKNFCTYRCSVFATRGTDECVAILLSLIVTKYRLVDIQSQSKEFVFSPFLYHFQLYRLRIGYNGRSRRSLHPSKGIKSLCTRNIFQTCDNWFWFILFSKK